MSNRDLGSLEQRVHKSSKLSDPREHSGMIRYPNEIRRRQKLAAAKKQARKFKRAQPQRIRRMHR